MKCCPLQWYCIYMTMVRTFHFVQQWKQWKEICWEICWEIDQNICSDYLWWSWSDGGHSQHCYPRNLGGCIKNFIKRFSQGRYHAVKYKKIKNFYRLMRIQLFYLWTKWRAQTSNILAMDIFHAVGNYK